MPDVPEQEGEKILQALAKVERAAEERHRTLADEVLAIRDDVRVIKANDQRQDAAILDVAARAGGRSGGTWGALLAAMVTLVSLGFQSCQAPRAGATVQRAAGGTGQHP